jgi:putative endonuclease
MPTHHRAQHLIRGEQAEQVACQYLIEQGLDFVDKNIHCQQGELDLIMRDKQALVIVEVRFRQSNKYGGAVESITQKKQSRIIMATQQYLYDHQIDSAIRFDVVAMSSYHTINWIKNAFQT